MLYWTILKVALKSLLANRLRSILAMLGIIIGVAAVVSMLALGSGAQRQILEQVQAMGSNLLMVRAGQSGRRGVRSGSVQTLTLEDGEALLEQVESVRMASPVVMDSQQFKHMNNNKQGSVIGAAPTYLAIRNYEVERGRSFTDDEIERSARVALLGPEIVQDLFGDKDPLNRRVRVGNLNFLVIGVLKAKGDQGWYNPDNQAIVPYTTAMKQILGVDYLREVNLQLEPGSDQQAVQAEVEALLRKRHRIQSGQEDDFYVRNHAEMVNAATEMTRTFTILLGSVAAISLLVGGIGIMNIMLVTVTERTREIGVRKAVGAKDRDVLFQFLVEAIIMSGLGGLIGLGVGVGGALAIARFSQFQTVVEPSAVVMAICFSAAVGVFFGFYPARRAAQLDPIDALQYE